MVWGIGSAVLAAVAAIWQILKSKNETPNHKMHVSGLSVVAILTCVAAISATITNHSDAVAKDKQLREIQDQLDDVLGPSLSIERMSMVSNGDGTVYAGGLVHNTGRSKALKVHAFIMLGFSAIGDSAPDFSNAYSENEAEGKAPIGADMSEILRTSGSTPEDKLAKLRSEGRTIYVLGSVWYEDIRERRHELPFCYLYNSDKQLEARTPRTCKK